MSAEDTNGGKAFLFAGVPAGTRAAGAGAIRGDRAYRATWRAGEEITATALSLEAELPEARDLAAVAHGCAAFDALEARALLDPDDALAEHSLGLYAALYAAGALDLAGAFAVAREAARALMAEAARGPGGLLAVVGLPPEAVEALAAESGCDVANFNSARQAVLGGDGTALEHAATLAAERGALDVRRLPFEAAVHTPRCAGAAAHLSAFIAGGGVRVRPPKRRLMAHTGPAWLESREDVEAALEANLRTPVRWHQAVLALGAAGYRRFVDLGPGDALGRMVRFIDRGASAVALDGSRDLAAAERFLEERTWSRPSPAERP